MGLKVVEDVGAPLAVTAVDLLTTEFVADPAWNAYSSFILTGLGYITAAMNVRIPYADFVKNLGVASLPQTAHHIYNWAKTGTLTRRAAPAASRMALRPVSRQAGRPVSRLYEKEFEGASAF